MLKTFKNVNRQDCVPTHEIASSSTENILQLAPETQQISATELNGERCQNVDVAATHPPATGDCGRAPVESRLTASSTGDPAALPTLMIKDGLKLSDLNSFPHLPLSTQGFGALLVVGSGPRYNLPHRTLVGRWGVGGNPTVFMCNIYLSEKFRWRWSGHL
ncbi:hypothetical protein J6590_077297 [Homalodisca vitripennis]|nr:hypothetical protein J6590_077297 [Homalodisca vitripennis]